MVKIILEMWPGGYESHKEHLGSINIINDGKGTEKIANYDVTLFDDNGDLSEEVRIEDFPREKRVFNLLHTSLKRIFETELTKEDLQNIKEMCVYALYQGPWSNFSKMTKTLGKIEKIIKENE